MNLYRCFGIDLEKRQVISIVGGGGKTSTMFELSKELKDLGKKVLVTTSTSIMMPERDQYDEFLTLQDGRIDEDRLVEAARPGTVTVLVGELIRQDKVKGIEEEIIDYIDNEEIFDYIIVEADGSRMRSIKAPREGEPLIPNSTDTVIGVIGMDAYGKEIDEDTVHRLEIFREILDVEDGEIIDEDVIVALVKHPSGLFKNSEDTKRYLLLNKSDSEELIKAGRRIKEKLPESLGLENVYMSSYKNGEISE